MEPLDLSAIKEDAELEAEGLPPYWVRVVLRLVAEAEQIHLAEQAVSEEAARRLRAEVQVAELRSALGCLATINDDEMLCWCPIDKPATADHMPACRLAQRAIRVKG